MEWKRRTGIDIGVVTTEEIFSAYNGDLISGIYDNAGKVRQFLYESYLGGTVWALLAGDYSVVPIRYGCGYKNYWTSPYFDPPKLDDYKIPTDLYFADFNGDWDVDGDVYTGEISASDGDSPDYNPEIFVGRLLCSNNQDILNWIEKVIKYEQNPGNGDLSYLTKSFMVGADEVRNEMDIVSPHLPGSLIHTKWKELPSGSDLNPTFPLGFEVVSEMNNNYGLHSWFMHGAPFAAVCMSTGYNHPPRWGINVVEDFEGNQVSETNNYLGALTNKNYPSIIYSIGCTQTPFDDYEYELPPGVRNLGEGFTVMYESGGPAFLGNTRYGWVDFSYHLFERFADLIRIADTGPLNGKSFLHIGVAELVSKKNYSSHFLSYAHNLVGCPETQIWTNTPSQFASATVTDGGSSITVNTSVSGCDINVSSVNNGLSYSFTAEDVTSFTFNTSIRPLIITVTKSQYLPYTAITGGTLDIDATLWGRLSVLGHLTVASGRTLTIQPGTILNFPAYSALRTPDYISLHVNGTLNAQGTSTNKIVFDREGNSGNWGSIILSGSSASSSLLDNVIVKNGIGIRFLNDANATLRNSNIEDCTYGVYIYNSQPRILNNTIYDVVQNGIFGEASGKSPEIIGNTIKRTGSKNYQGIYLLNYTNPFIIENDIQGFSYGIYYGGGGSGIFTDENFTTPFINNRITNNTKGLSVAWGSYLIAGDFELPLLYIGHNNSIYNNLNADAEAYQSGTIIAQRNWWGSSGGQFVTYSNGYINSFNPLTSDPWSGNLRRESIDTESPIEGDTINFSDILIGIDLESRGQVDDAINHYKKMLKKITHPKFALTRLVGIKKKYSINNIQDYLRVLLNSNITYKPAVLNLTAGMCLEDGRYEEAIQLYNLIITNYPNSDDAINALFEKFFAALHIANDITEASQIFSQLQSLNITDEDFLARLDVVQTMLTGTSSIGLFKGSITDNENVEANLPKEYSLLGNYPNPFNPSTTISYTLPYQSSVELIIYDIIGSKVKIFNIPSQSSGYQNILWDGKNENGNSVSSGVYLYRISIKSLENDEVFMKTSKFMMLK